ncbi:hypothetical protein LXL04_032199 [Taraxacum kok-saghyz]
MTNNHNQNKLINHHHQLLPSPTTTTTTNRSNSSTITTTARSNSSPVTTARSNSTTQACAACRYQRRKCAPDCVLAPYFPHDRQRQFQNAHKLFGVSNITKLIRDLDPPQKDEAMRTIIYQSDVRAQDPVEGCYRIIRELHRQIEYSRAELEIVLHQLAICRAHAVQNQNQNQNLHHHQDQLLIDGVDCDIHLVSNPDDPQLYDDLDTENVNHHNYGLDLDLGQITQQQEHEDHNAQIHDQGQDRYILGQQNLNNQDDGCADENVVPLQEINSWAASSAICLEAKPPVDECDDFKPLMINEIPAGDRHEFKFEFDDINEPSEETLFNEGNQKAMNKDENVSFFSKEENVSYQQHNEDHDLKGAATLFTLTNWHGNWSRDYQRVQISPTDNLRWEGEVLPDCCLDVCSAAEIGFTGRFLHCSTPSSPAELLLPFNAFWPPLLSDSGDTEAVRLGAEIRQLPNDHDAKLQIVEVGKISLYAASSSFKEVQKLVLDPK